MGEYADMAIDDALNGGHWSEWYDGEDPEDADWAPYSRRDRVRRPKYRTCSVCGASPLFFEQDDNGDWILAEYASTEAVWERDYTRHVCKMKKFGK